MITAPPFTTQNGAAVTVPGAAPVALDAVGRKEEILTAHALLGGRPWVAIEHNGQHYRLQTTRAGKLILTK